MFAEHVTLVKFDLKSVELWLTCFKCKIAVRLFRVMLLIRGNPTKPSKCSFHADKGQLKEHASVNATKLLKL